MTEPDPNQPSGIPYSWSVPPPNTYPAPPPVAAPPYPQPPPGYPPLPTAYPAPYPPPIAGAQPLYPPPVPGTQPLYPPPVPGAQPLYPPPGYAYQGAPYPPYSPYAAYPPPARKRRGWLIAAIVVVAVLAAGGITATALNSGKDPVKTAATSPATTAPVTESPAAAVTPTATAAAAPGTTKLSPRSLYATLVPYPSGVREINPSGTSNGIMTMSQFSKREYSDLKKAIDYLTYYKFSSAVTKMWATSHDRGYVFVTLVEFDGYTSNAQTFATDEADNDRDASPAADKNGAMADQMDGFYFEFTTPDKTTGWRYIETFARVGNIVIETEYDSKSTLTANDLAMVLKLAKDQAARIK